MIVVAALLALHATARAQFAIDTARGLVGKKVTVVFKLPGGALRTGTTSMTATMQLSNPTVFYPERFIAPSGDSVLSAQLVRLQDSIYTIALTMRRDAANTNAGDTLVSIEGEALAGSDSVCVVSLRNVVVAEAPVADSRGVVITRSIGTPLPYVRFAILEQNYPNPVQRGVPTSWAYRIDKRSIVRFFFYDLLGREVFIANLGEQPIGPHLFVYTPPFDLPTGLYFVRLITNSGSADKVMHVLR